mgnify:CR=1 FL=1
MGLGRWLPSPLLRGSALLHPAMVLLAAVRPSWWPWILTGMVADHAAIVAGGLWPRSTWIGPNLRRLPPGRAAGAVALSFDDGPDPEITPGVLDLLAAAGARASFFWPALRAAAQPELVQAAVVAGHRVENHSRSHPAHFAFLPPRAMTVEIEEAQRILEALTGRRPRCFRAPAGIRAPWTQPLLERAGLRLVSWTRRGFDTTDRSAERVTRRLLDGLAEGDILLLHDRGSAVVLEVLERVLSELDRRGWAGVGVGED